MKDFLGPRFILYSLFRSQKNIMNLLQELDVEVYDQWTTGNRILHNLNGNIKTYSSPLPPLSYLALLDTWWFFYKVTTFSPSFMVCRNIDEILMYGDVEVN